MVDYLVRGSIRVEVLCQRQDGGFPVKKLNTWEYCGKKLDTWEYCGKKLDTWEECGKKLDTWEN
jgi:hypothetical protein